MNWFDQNPTLSLIIILGLVIGAGLVMYVFARLLIKSLNDSARFEQPLVTLMLILGTVTIVALIGALFTRDESAFTIAATGVGAFAGALTARAQFSNEVESPEVVVVESPAVTEEPEYEVVPDGEDSGEDLEDDD